MLKSCLSTGVVGTESVTPSTHPLEHWGLLSEVRLPIWPLYTTLVSPWIDQQALATIQTGGLAVWSWPRGCL